MSELFDFSKNGPMWTGIVVGLIAWFFMTRFKKFDATTMAAVIGALFAGVLLSFVMKGQPEQVISEVLGRYAFGLLIGTAIYFGVYRVSRKSWPTRMTR